jgi:hypothetical protein
MHDPGTAPAMKEAQALSIFEAESILSQLLELRMSKAKL